MANSYLTVMGAEKYLNSINDSLFAGVTFPEGIDRTTAINNILLECGEFPVLYSDLDFFKEAVTTWGNKYNLAFEKWVQGFAEEFSPIDNYDRHEFWEDHSTGQDKTSYGKKNTTTYGKKNTTTYGKTTTDTYEVSAANDSGYQAKNKNTNATSNTDSDQLSGSDSDQLSGIDTIDNKADSAHTGRIHGNIGVMRTTDILSGWLQFYKDYNIYDIMADTFVREFCILVY